METTSIKRSSKLSAARWIGLSLGILAIVVGVLIWRNYFETYHFSEVDRGVLYRDGNRSMREFSTGIHKARVRTIVMLNDHDELLKEPFKSEAEFCRQREVNLVHIAVGVGQRPTTENVRRFLGIMAESKNHPVLVHCAQGVRRTAMMVAAYQMTMLKYDAQRAKDAILPWGRKPERLADIRGFIDDYDPETRTVGSAHLITLPQDSD